MTAHRHKNTFFPPHTTDKISKVCNFPITIAAAPFGCGKSTAFGEFFPDSPCFNKRFFGSRYPLKSEILQYFKSHNACESEPCTLNFNLTEPTVIIIDDYHNIENDENNDFIINLSDLNNENLHIVIIAEKIVFNPKFWCTYHDKINLLTFEDFALTPADIRHRFSSLNSDTPDSRTINALWQSSDGWPVMIYMAQRSPSRSERSLLDSRLFEYFQNIIESNIQKSDFDVLLKLCVIGKTFTTEQAFSVTGDREIGEKLLKICKNILFIKAKDGYTFEFTAPLLSLLKRHSDYMLSEDEKRRISLCIADNLMKNQNFGEAFRHYCRAKNSDGIMLSFSEANDYTPECANLLAAFYPQLSRSQKEKYPLALSNIMLCFSKNGMTEYEKSAFSDLQSVMFENNIDAKKLHQINININTAELWHCGDDCRDIPKLDFSESDVKNIPNLALHGAVSVLEFFCTDENAQTSLSEICSCERKFGNIYAGAGDIATAESEYLSHNLAHAETLAIRGIRNAKKSNVHDIAEAGELLCVKIYFAQGKIKRATELANSLYTESYNPLIVQCAELFKNSRIYENECLYRSDCIIKDTEFTKYFYPELFRKFLYEEKYCEILSFENEINPACKKNKLIYTYCLVYLGIAYRNLGLHEESDKIFSEAMDFIEKNNFYMIIAECMPYVKNLIQNTNLSCSPAVASMCSDYAKIKNTTAHQKNALSAFPELTSRENEIASLASHGFTNSDIAQQLVISPNTVKATMKKIFGKLGISSRKQLKERSENE